MLGASIIKLKARSGFDRLNRRDLAAYLKDWKDDAVFVYPGHISVSGEHRGKDEIENWWKHFFENFPTSKFSSIGLYLKNPFSVLPSNELMVHWEVKVTDRKAKEFHNSGVSFVQVENGKITFFKDYIFDLDTLVKAWGEKN